MLLIIPNSSIIVSINKDTKSRTVSISEHQNLICIGDRFFNVFLMLSTKISIVTIIEIIKSKLKV